MSKRSSHSGCMKWTFSDDDEEADTTPLVESSKKMRCLHKGGLLILDGWDELPKQQCSTSLALCIDCGYLILVVRVMECNGCDVRMHVTQEVMSYNVHVYLLPGQL